MQHIPVLISIAFIATTIIAIGLFYNAAGRKPIFLWIAGLWILLQGVVALTGFYTITDGLPPRFALLVVPPLVLIAALFFSKGGREYIDAIDVKKLMLLHAVRLPVETVLFFLFINKLLPQIMTAEGANFDILSGISAIILYWYISTRQTLPRKVMLVWNIVCLLLLVNIVTIAILSAPFQFQQFGFEQPNVALLHFPMIWLPCCVVPLVLFSHLVAIMQLTRPVARS